MSLVSQGDIVLAVPSPACSDKTFQYVLVIDKLDNWASCVLVTLRLDLAIELDVIVPGSENELGADLVVHSMTGCRIPYTRLSSPVAKCDQSVIDEVELGRFSEPSGRYASGAPRLPIGDYREEVLTETYVWFFESFNIHVSELRQIQIEVETPELLSQKEKMDAMRQVYLYVENSFNNERPTAEVFKIVKDWIELAEEDADSIDELQMFLLTGPNSPSK